MAGHQLQTNGQAETPLRSLDTLISAVRDQLHAELLSELDARVQAAVSAAIGPALMAGVIEALQSLTVNVAAPVMNCEMPEMSEAPITVQPAPVTVQRAVKQRIVYDNEGRISHLEPM